MANNKSGDNRGINASDAEQIRRVGRGETKARTEPSARTRQVPVETTKPGRAYDSSAPENDNDVADVDDELHGDTMESNAGRHVGHDNK